MATNSQQSVQALPIDIHYNKLLDWLINRRHCDQQWQKTAAQIREKINTAIQDMPPVTEITQLLQGSYINYFHCQQIVELLKDTDFGKKNMIGQYSSQKMKDWMEIIKMYETDGVYLAETAQMMARNVNYEIPAMKKQISKCQQLQKECDRKEADYASKSTDLKKKYDSKCKELGIQGKKIKSELAALVEDLPKTFDKICDSTSGLTLATDFYKDFVQFLTNEDPGENNLPMLKHIIKNGNTTTYEWRTGTKPEKIDCTKLFIDTTDEQDPLTDSADIDWGAVGEAGDGNIADIDFVDDINLDLSEITLETGGNVEGTENQDAIDFSVVEPDKDSNGIDYSDLVIVEHAEDGVAKGEDALSLLDNPKTRAMFLDDLLELEAFLVQRLEEMKEEGNFLSSSQFQSAPSSLQVTRETVEGMLIKVKDIYSQLTTVKMHHLMLIRNSPRYVDRLRDDLKQILTLADKMTFHEKEMVVKKEEAIQEQTEIQPKLDMIIKKTKEVQKQMETEISKKYKDRNVNIMGEINTV
ncbi:CDK5 regulatory subunit-associated protein 3-like [Mytilus californianus]|uniref:CDK5 regulatory subunit-associated protein 3-like n=1 Tax=Mytilus californianus TaxID=6549 RepID=UPI0022483771|nr:CDK5 regulatory subunit-associated protein 3-like [Mytilus californianus]